MREVRLSNFVTLYLLYLISPRYGAPTEELDSSRNHPVEHLHSSGDHSIYLKLLMCHHIVFYHKFDSQFNSMSRYYVLLDC